MNYTALAAGTLVIIIFSWFLSVKHGRYHGIPRFFAFESILVMTLLNLDKWFADPFSAHQAVSWVLLLLSLYPVTAGFILLKKRGEPTANFENTSVLVTSGIYRLIRHPLYLSVFLLGTGVMLKDPGPVQLALGAVNLIAVYVTSRIEEKEMIARFGDEYRNYMKNTRMFIPGIL